MADSMMRVAARGLDGTAKPLSADNGGILQIDHARFYDYELMAYTIIGWKRDMTTNWVYGVDTSNQLRKSVDGGITWGNVLTTFAAGVSCGVYTSDCLLVWVSDGTLVRCTGDNTFTTILSGIHVPRSFMGVAVSTAEPNKIMFVEYAMTTEELATSIDLHVYYSADAGLNWSIVLTKNHPTDIHHFHTVDFIQGNSVTREWVVTSGEGGTQVNWWKSLDNGTSWTKIVGGFLQNGKDDQMFRTLGVRKVAGDTYIWATDAGNYPYVMACKDRDLPIDGVVPDTVKSVLPLNAPSWGMRGDKNILVTCSTSDSATFSGENYSKILVSFDGGGSWYTEYSFTSNFTAGGIVSIQGPDFYGRYYIFRNSPDTKSIRMTPRKMAQYPMKPINQEMTQINYRRTIHSATSPNITNATYPTTGVDRAVYNPSILVKNSTNVAVTLVFKDVKGASYQDSTGNTSTVSVPAGKNVMLRQGDQFIQPIIPEGAFIGVLAVGSNPTSGSVDVILYGDAYDCADHRALR